MRRSNRLDTPPLEAALADAVSAARWERRDLEARRPTWIHHELMLARAAELAMSPLARDQLMSLALERQTQSGPPGRSLIDPDPSARDRDRIAGRVFALGPHKGSETDAFVRTVEGQHSKRLRESGRFGGLARSLELDAVLQERLWNHPGIPASDAVRLAMLCSIPKLRARAQDLAIFPSAWWPALNRRLPRVFKRAGP